MNVSLDPRPSSFFAASELASLDLVKIPQHIALIMDGNRRWAAERSLPSVMGHWEGAEALIDIVLAAAEVGFKTVTAYSFSTENWHRSDCEVEALMEIFEVYLRSKKELMVKEGIALGMIGDLHRLPESVQEAFLEAKEATAECSRINLVLALNYGARDEIRRALCKIVAARDRYPFPIEEVTEEFIAQHLDTKEWGDPDLMIRTSGEWRVSNFLLWQLSYAEIYVTERLWPDFSSKDLLNALVDYQKRDRRLGGR
ncbi:MAG: di-trans,poly-cis-decaprenylcistransferase [Verrucomicrobiota bacterium]|nr:di-trans,poly-cis-decaprenylcistransferase [Verrucomicrobiota bacterium]